jgi:hypothetical protein
MGYIKEPEGVDLIVAPSTFTAQDRKMISNIIANYKKTRTSTKANTFHFLQGVDKLSKHKPI